MLKDTTKLCKICGATFARVSHNKLTCSLACGVENLRILKRNASKKNWDINKEKIMSARSRNKTEEQKRKQKEYNTTYRYTSFEHYIKDLIRTRKRNKLTLHDVISVFLRQEGKCALSGISLRHERGSLYNLSIDRIKAGEEYSVDNIQLICRCINNWRSNTSIEDFIYICKKVAEHNALRPRYRDHLSG